MARPLQKPTNDDGKHLCAFAADAVAKIPQQNEYSELINSIDIRMDTAGGEHI